MCFFFSSRRRHTRFKCAWSSDVCSSDLHLHTHTHTHTRHTHNTHTHTDTIHTTHTHHTHNTHTSYTQVIHTHTHTHTHTILLQNGLACDSGSFHGLPF